VNADARVMPEPRWDYEAERRRSFARGRFPAHQSVVMSSEDLRRLGGFDTTYLVAADYAAILRFAAEGRPDIWDLTIAEFRVGGLSSIHWKQANREFHRARREILRPNGWSGIRERVDTHWAGAKTSAYRALWAPGRPLHSVINGAREGNP
jgi:hypothetical protein